MFSNFHSGARAPKKNRDSHSHFLDQFTRPFNNNNLFFQLDPKHKIVSKSNSTSDKEFKFRIRKCLLLLKQKAPEYYGLFCLFNRKIRVVDSYTCANFDNNSIDLSSSLEYESDAVVAATLIHETIHFWQQDSGSPHFGTEKHSWQDGNVQTCELEAIKYQLEVLRLLGGTDEEIKFLEKQRGTHDGFIRYQP